MKSKIALSILLNLSVISGQVLATIDSYTTVTYPVHAMHEERICMVDSLAHDGISNMGTSQMLAVNALNGPFKIPGIQAGEDQNGLVENANMLYKQGISLSFEFDYDTMNSGILIIDASEATKIAKNNNDRADIIRMVKLAIYSGVINTADSLMKTIKVELKGLPDQTGLAQKIPVKFNSKFTKSSPYLKQIQTELNIKAGIKNC